MLKSQTHIITRVIALALAAAALTGCNEDAPQAPVDDDPAPSINAYFQALPDWEVPSTLTNPPNDLQDQQHHDGDAYYTCGVREFDYKKNFDALIAVGADAAAMKPGMLLQGEAMKNGQLKVLPAPRAPINISINLAIDDPSREIVSPTSTTIQDAIADLQRAADSRLGNLDVIPAQVVLVNEVAHSFEHAMMQSDISLKYSGVFKSASFESSFSTEKKVSSHTVVVRMYQPMYTISFAGDEMQTPADFFDPGFTAADLEQQEQLGNVGPGNLPCFVQSVTYGRMLVYTMTTSESYSAEELQAAVNATYGLWDGSANLTQRQVEILKSCTIVWKAFGGTQGDAFNAIRNNDFNEFFTPAPATTAVPLSYKVVYMKDRDVAVIGDATKYKVFTCEPNDLRFTVSLDSVQVVSGCQFEQSISLHVDVVTADGTRILLNWANTTPENVKWFRSDIQFDMPTSSSSFLHIDAWARSYPNWDDALWEFDRVFHFPFDEFYEFPTQFTLVETASPQARACTLKLFVSVKRELVD